MRSANLVRRAASARSVLVIDSKSVRPQGVEPLLNERTTLAFYDSPKNAKGRVFPNDVLLNSTGRGTIGRAACYQLAAPALCDNRVTILRPNQKICHAIYLTLFLNSPAGLAQSEQFQSGSSGQLEIYPEHIEQFLIYIPRDKDGTIDLAWQSRLVAKIQAAADANTAAGEKLEDAKRLVEEEIMVAHQRTLPVPASSV
jgi:Type I restriction modification DNA specificity domain